jgi:hypothetical protein
LVRRGEEDETFQFDDFKANAQVLDKLLFVVGPHHHALEFVAAEDIPNNGDASVPSE